MVKFGTIIVIVGLPLTLGIASRAQTPAPAPAPPAPSDPACGPDASVNALQKRLQVLQQLLAKRNDLIDKTQKLILDSWNSEKPPDPNKLQPISTATGFRSKDYREYPLYVQRMIDEFEATFSLYSV